MFGFQVSVFVYMSTINNSNRNVAISKKELSLVTCIIQFVTYKYGYVIVNDLVELKIKSHSSVGYHHESFKQLIYRRGPEHTSNISSFYLIQYQTILEYICPVFDVFWFLFD